MRLRSTSVLGLVVSFALGCGSVSTSGGQGGSGGQGTGGSGTGGSGTGGHGTGGEGTGSGGKGGGTGTGGVAGGGSGGHGGAAGGGAGHGGTGGAGTGGHAGGGGGNMGRGGAGGANGGPCWSSTDCGFATCETPGSPLCGGACIGPQHPCTSDNDCAADAAAPTVCEQVPCSCPAPGMGCVPGCMTSADCPEGESCTASHHCRPTVCVPTPTTTGCPADFTCSAGACARKACQNDAECSAACVLNRCYSGPGTCRLPVP